MTEQALRHDKVMSNNADGLTFGIALVTDPRMDRSRYSECFIVAIPQGRPGIPVEARPIDVTLRGLSHFIVNENGALKHSFSETVFSSTVVSSPNIRGAISRGAEIFSMQLFPDSNQV